MMNSGNIEKVCEGANNLASPFETEDGSLFLVS